MAIGTGTFPLPAGESRLTSLAPFLAPTPQERGGISLPMMTWPHVAQWGQMLRIAAAARQLCIGLDAFQETKIVSKMALAFFSNDGAARLYRNASTQLERHAQTFYLVDVGVAAESFGGIIHRPGSQIKFCVLTHDDAVTKVLFALASALGTTAK